MTNKLCVTDPTQSAKAAQSVEDERSAASMIHIVQMLASTFSTIVKMSTHLLHGQF
jgi:hypothetical protein